MFEYMIRRMVKASMLPRGPGTLTGSQGALSIVRSVRSAQLIDIIDTSEIRIYEEGAVKGKDGTNG